MPDLGRAKKIIISKEDTTIVEGAGTQYAIEGRIQQIRAQIEETTSDYDREKLQERLAKLVGGVALIKVGAATETEMKEKKARVEDAMHATKAAAEEGIVPGGGIALIRAGDRLADLAGDDSLTHDEQVGVKIVSRAIEEPLRWIARNAGHEGSVVVNRVKEADGASGFNAASEKYENLVDAGVIDPTQGGPPRPPERGLDRQPAPHHRGAGHRDPREGRQARRRPRRPPRHGRHGLLVRPRSPSLSSGVGASGRRRPFSWPTASSGGGSPFPRENWPGSAAPPAAPTGGPPAAPSPPGRPRRAFPETTA